MNSLSHKTLTHFLTQHPNPFSLLLIHRFPFSSSSTTHQRLEFDDGDSVGRNVRVSVWWDFENCVIPPGANVFRVAQSITAAVRVNGIKGPVQITAFGDVFQISRANQVVLSATGVNLSHVPSEDKNIADRPLLVDLMYWVSQNPPPAHLFLISGDKGIASVLHRLRMNNYNILLACQDSPPSVLCTAASIMWRWNELVKGENLVGRHFNKPPDGPFGSWYGNFKLPLEDPYAVTETQSSSISQNDDSPGEISSDLKVRPVPKAVFEAIHGIVKSYPDGLVITDLRAALRAAKIHVDKDFYGYKKFSCLLLSMQNVLKLHFRADGQFFISSVSPRIVEPLVSNTGISECSNARSRIQDFASVKPNLEVDSVAAKVVDQNSPLSATLKLKQGLSDGSQESKTSHANGSIQSAATVADTSAQVSSPIQLKEKVKTLGEVNEKVKPGDTDIGKGHDSPAKEMSSNEVSGAQVIGNNMTAANVGIFQRAWAKLFSRNKVSETQDQVHPSKGGFEKANPRNDGSTGNSSDSVPDSSLLRSDDGKSDALGDLVARNEGSGESKGDITRKGHVDESNASEVFVSRVIGWCKFWKRKSSTDGLSRSSDADSEQMSDTGKREFLLTDSQWRDIESFIGSYKGSSIIANSRSREDIAQDLQKSGPTSLQSLSMVDLLHLVELLISEKKWIEECPSQTYPFRAIQPNQSSADPPHTPNSSGLSSIFMHPSLKQTSTSKTSEHHEEKNVGNLPQSGVPSFTSRKQAKKSRTEILTDCRKLVEALLKSSPEGFNIRSFRKLFVERYGYVLFVEKLGYSKLESLLQIIPWVKVESGYVRPIKATPSIVDALWKGDDNESPWEELGPVEDSGSLKVKDDYESSLSDDELSDSEGEGLPPGQVEAPNKAKVDGNESSLLQVLDSWYSIKGANNSKDCAENADVATGSSRPSPKTSDTSRTSMKQGDPKIESSPDQEWRRDPPKSYCFVADTVDNEKDKLIDGILGTLKKSGESKLQV